MADYGMGKLRALVAERSPAEREQIEQAFAFALAAHGEVARKSGEPFITHPVAVTTILASQGLDTPTLVAGLLHDTVEDVETVSFEDIERLFGPEVCLMVRGVTRLSKLQAKRDHSGIEPDWIAEDLREFMRYAHQEPRVLLLKLADRLHNMRTLGSLPPRKQWNNAQETLLFFAPLAAHLGMSDVRTELMDLSWQYLAPQEFDALREELDKLRPKGVQVAAYVGDQLRESLRADPLLAGLGLEVEVSSRVKSAWRAHQKIKSGMTLDEIVDLLSLRVIVDLPAGQTGSALESSLCYVVVGHLHRLWEARTQYFKDYVGSPKRNGYQSLHTVILAEGIGQLELQVRSRAMHEVAQRGILTFWQGGQLQRPLNGPQLTARLTDELRDILSASDALSRMQEQLGAKVMVYTPQGRRVWLPKGSTALDFAYFIHSDLGRHTVEARINGRRVAPSTPLRSGAVVEIIKDEAAQPQREWMNVVVSQQAREELRSQLRELHGWQQMPEHPGYHLLRQTLLARGQRSQRLFQHKVLEEAAYRLVGRRNTDELLLALELGQVEVGAVADLVTQLAHPQEG